MPRKPGRESTRPAPRAPSSVLVDFFLADFLNDRDRGICSLGCGTIIRRSTQTAMAVDADDLSKQVGYICGPCTDAVLTASDDPREPPRDLGEPPW